MISEDALLKKDVNSNLRDIFYMKIIVFISLTNLVTSSPFSSFFSPLRRNQNQKLDSQQLALYHKGVSNSLDCQKGILLHVISVHNTVSRYYAVLIAGSILRN